MARETLLKNEQLNKKQSLLITMAIAVSLLPLSILEESTHLLKILH